MQTSPGLQREARAFRIQPFFRIEFVESRVRFLLPAEKCADILKLLDLGNGDQGQACNLRFSRNSPRLNCLRISEPPLWNPQNRKPELEFGFSLPLFFAN